MEWKTELLFEYCWKMILKNPFWCQLQDERLYRAINAFDTVTTRTIHYAMKKWNSTKNPLKRKIKSMIESNGNNAKKEKKIQWNHTKTILGLCQCD